MILSKEGIGKSLRLTPEGSALRKEHDPSRALLCCFWSLTVLRKVVIAEIMSSIALEYGSSITAVSRALAAQMTWANNADSIPSAGTGALVDARRLPNWSDEYDGARNLVGAIRLLSPLWRSSLSCPMIPWSSSILFEICSSLLSLMVY